MLEVDHGAPSVPEPGQAPLPAPSVTALLRRNGTHPAMRDRPAVRFGDLIWTHSDYWRECLRWASMLHALRPSDGPFHLGILSDNTPDYVAALGGCALAGASLVGLNPTRRGEHLARDIRHTDVGMLVVEPRHRALIEPVIDDLDVPAQRRILASRFDPVEETNGWIDLRAALPDSGDEPARETPLEATWCLVFTSGTSAAPKAVICTHRRMLQTGERLRQLLGVTMHDTGYVSMPLFHSNALMVGVMPALVVGASVGLARRFTASGWVADVRRYGATWFNYTGKPLSYILTTPEQPDDADNPLRVAYGNEGSARVIEEFSRRFGVQVIDAFGPTEGGIAVTPDSATPPGALGPTGEYVKVVNPDGDELPRARFDDGGRLVNADECVGEIVNTRGPGPFEGYYRNDDATRAATRRGWYWTGDLGYIDEGGYLYFAGRTADWLRVDGENFPAAPIERALVRHPDVSVAAVYGVPDVHAGDQVMAALVLHPGVVFDPEAFGAWVDAQPDLSPKWRPRYVRIAAELPTTGTNKVLVRRLQHEGFRRGRSPDPIYARGRGEVVYTLLDAEAEAALRQAFEQSGRLRFWDL